MALGVARAHMRAHGHAHRESVGLCEFQFYVVVFKKWVWLNLNDALLLADSQPGAPLPFESFT